MIQISKRPDERRQDREERRLAFNHESAAGAAHRHRIDRKTKPRRSKKPQFVKKPYDLIDHIHPRHKREWMKAHSMSAAAS